MIGLIAVNIILKFFSTTYCSRWELCFSFSILARIKVLWQIEYKNNSTTFIIIQKAFKHYLRVSNTEKYNCTCILYNALKNIFHDWFWVVRLINNHSSNVQYRYLFKSWHSWSGHHGQTQLFGQDMLFASKIFELTLAFIRFSLCFNLNTILYRQLLFNFNANSIWKKLIQPISKDLCSFKLNQIILPLLCEVFFY